VTMFKISRLRLEYCQLHYSVDRIFFSDGAKFASSDDIRFYNSGNGTNYTAALEIMSRLGKRWDVIVLVTDYRFTTDDLVRIREIEKYGRYVFYYDENLEKIDVKSKAED
jgi:CRISPR/Cas system CMR-associated protein Cmr3 (group 5 of RAMP superfamily)